MLYSQIIGFSTVPAICSKYSEKPKVKIRQCKPNNNTEMKCYLNRIEISKLTFITAPLSSDEELVVTCDMTFRKRSSSQLVN